MKPLIGRSALKSASATALKHVTNLEKDTHHFIEAASITVMLQPMRHERANERSLDLMRARRNQFLH
jgi:hypothetical protein